MFGFISWIHHLLDPHCIHCKEEREDARICKSCEMLKSQLETANYEKHQLLNQLLEMNRPVIEKRVDTSEMKPIRPKNIPWSVARQSLEAEDREKAKLMKMKAEEIEQEVLQSHSEMIGKNA